MNNFKWGNQDHDTVELLKKEMYEQKIYEKIFEVEEGDIVVDLGASNGIFSYSIIPKKPRMIYLVEPISEHVDLINQNLHNYPHVVLKGVITDQKKVKNVSWGSFSDDEILTFTFEEFLEKYRLEKIDFLKVDIEGGEYDIFKEEHIDFLKNIPKIVVEFHLRKNDPRHLMSKFEYFRNNILQNFPNFHIYSLDGVDIKWDLWNDHFMEHYTEVIFYFDNRI